MIKRRAILAGLTAGGLALASTSAFAHRQMQSISVIKWNALSKTLTITHTLHMHDAEQALSRLGLLKKPDLTPLRARASLALYVQKHFLLRDLDNHDYDISIIGAEIDSSYVYIYNEVALSSMPSGLIITNTLLQDIYPDQANQVNVTLGGKTSSLMFRLGDGSKRVLA
ncbi:MAG: DUF6702 family protein [Robiginitomaculum sp.]